MLSRVINFTCYLRDWTTKKVTKITHAQQPHQSSVSESDIWEKSDRKMGIKDSKF